MHLQRMGHPPGTDRTFTNFHLPKNWEAFRLSPNSMSPNFVCPQFLILNPAVNLLMQ
jgi:hypothetical protein